MKATRTRMLSTKEVAQWFGVNPMTIYRKAKKGEIPAIKFGKQWLFPEDALNEWIAKRVGMSGYALAQKVASIEALPCDAMRHVMLVYVFGSAAAGVTTPLSDIDIAYLDDGSKDPFDFEIDLEMLVREHMPHASRIDLIRLRDAPLAVRYNVVSAGRLLYARSEVIRSEFEVDTITGYLDFDYMLKRYYQEVA